MIGTFDLGAPKNDVLAAIISATHSSKPSMLAIDVDFSNFASLSAVFSDNDQQYSGESEITITAKPTAAYTGSGVYQYKRLSLAQVLEFSHEDIVPIDVTDLALYPDPWVPPHPTVYDLLPAINAYFGINLTIDDVEDTPITRKVDTSPGCYSVFILAKADSWLWYGDCAFDIRPPFEQQGEETIPDVPLTDVIAITIFNGFNTPKLSGV